MIWMRLPIYICPTYGPLSHMNMMEICKHFRMYHTILFCFFDKKRYLKLIFSQNKSKYMQIIILLSYILMQSNFKSRSIIWILIALLLQLTFQEIKFDFP